MLLPLQEHALHSLALTMGSSNDNNESDFFGVVVTVKGMKRPPQIKIL
jgi:hypothetical protein